MKHLLKLLDWSKEEILEVLDLADKLKDENELVIEVSNTHANKIKDYFSSFMLIKKAGLQEKIKFLY